MATTCDTMVSKRRALLIGATGLTGGHLLQRLLSDRRYDAIHVLSRRPLSARADRLHPHVVDFDDLPPEHPAFRVDDVYCCLGTTIRQAGSRGRFRQVDYDYPMMTARAARAGGAETMVAISALGADPGSHNFYLRTKGELERDLQRLAFRHLVLVRPSLLIGRRESKRLLEGAGMWLLPKLAFLMQGPLKPYRAIEAGVVANAMHHLAWQAAVGTRVVTSAELQLLGHVRRRPTDG
jgi:uncharacterized protein YbjT (DUF2867 family)